MESQPQNPEFRINPENFHPCDEVCGPVLQKLRVGSQPAHAMAANL